MQAVEESRSASSPDEAKQLKCVEDELAAARASIKELTSRVNDVAAEKVWTPVPLFSSFFSAPHLSFSTLKFPFFRL